MNFIKKCFIAGGVLSLGFCFGASMMMVSAHHHHWSPLDPSTYWSPTAVDEADGNNPGHYFYHDLGNSGGNVFDYTRAIKEKLKTEKFMIWYGYLKNIFDFNKKEMTPMGDESVKNLESLHQKTINMGKNHPLTANDVDSATVDIKHDEGGQAYFDKDDNPRRWAGESYQVLAQRLSDANVVNQQIHDDLAESLKALDNAQSEKEVAQASAHIKALKAMAWNQFSAYFVVRAQIKGIHDRSLSALDEKARQNVNFKNFYFDPYNNPEDKKVVESYEKESGVEFYKPHGMPSFSD